MTADGDYLDSLERGLHGPEARNTHGGLVRSLHAGDFHACSGSRGFGTLPGHMGRSHGHDSSRARDHSRRRQLHLGGNRHFGVLATGWVAAEKEQEVEVAAEGERNSRS